MPEIRKYCVTSGPAIALHQWEEKKEDLDSFMKRLENQEFSTLKVTQAMLKSGWVPFGGAGFSQSGHFCQAWVKYDTDTIQEKQEKACQAEVKTTACENTVIVAEGMLDDSLDTWNQRAMDSESEQKESDK